MTIQKATITNQVLERFKAKEYFEASEILVNYILDTNHIHTTKQDTRREVYIYSDGIFLPEGKSHVQVILRKIMGTSYSSIIFKLVIEKIEIDTFINPEEFFSKKYLDEIPVQNGILNLQTKKLSEFTPDKIFFNKLPIEFNPQQKCPAITQFFEDILKDKSDKEILFELIGFCLYKEYTIEKCFMFLGMGRNGKSKVLSLIKRFLGTENCSSVPLSQLKADSSGVCELHNRLVNIAGDLSPTSLKDTGMLKSVTGRDLVNSKRKYLRDLIFENHSKLIFSCNQLPRTYDTSQGFWSRWILLEFPYQFLPKSEIDKLEDKTFKKIEDTFIIDKISTPEELSGLLNEALEGLKRLLTNEKFSYSKGTSEIMDLWIRMSDSFRAFCFDCIEEDATNYVTKKDLRLIFSRYCKFYGIKGTSNKDIKATLEDLFGTTDSRKLINNEYEHVWIGFKFKMSKVTTFFPKVSFSYNM